MGFFEEMGEKITAKSKEVAAKAQGAAKLADLRSQATRLEGKIKSCYQNIGEKVYQNEKDQEHTGLEAEFDSINAAFAELDSIHKQIAKLKGLRKCKSCGAQVDMLAAFCPKCGGKMEEEETPQEGAPEDVVDIQEAEGAREAE